VGVGVCAFVCVRMCEGVRMCMPRASLYRECRTCTLCPGVSCRGIGNEASCARTWRPRHATGGFGVAGQALMKGAWPLQPHAHGVRQGKQGTHVLLARSAHTRTFAASLPAPLLPAPHASATPCA